MAQIWIKSNEDYISARMITSQSKSSVGYLLVPGLFEPSCDLYYFFQELIEELRINDKCGLVFEFCGSGDSYGKSSLVTVSTMIHNLQDVLNYMKAQGVTNIIAVGRGIGANLLLAIANDNAIQSMYMINPMLMGEKATCILKEFLNDYSSNEICLTEKILVKLQSVLYTAGVDMSNIEEEIVSLKLFQELLDTDYIFNLSSHEKISKILVTKDMWPRYVDNVEEYLSDSDFTNYNDRFNMIRDIISNE